MILGIGTDLCSVSRIQQALDRWGPRFANKVLVESEFKRYERHRSPANFIAKRFAAKEAFSKAMGSGIRFPVHWHTVWVINNASGKPDLRFSPALETLLKERGIGTVHLSLTDEKDIAAAFVILEGAA